MSLPTPRRGESLISVKRQLSLRKSARKSFPQTKPEVPVKTPESGVTVETPEETFKTPKRIRRKSVKLDKDSKESKSKNTGCFSIPNIVDNGNKDEKVCSFYRKTMGPNGDVKFSPSLIKYFMKIDSPESEDLRFKRFNTSFRRERPTNRDSLKIFTEEELNDETKWLQNVPNIVSNMPDIPGSEHRDVFASLPNIDFDFDFDLKEGKNKRKSVRCTPFKGKPLPDEHLLFDYSPVFRSEAKWEEAECGHEEKEEKVDNISGSLLSSPSDGPITQDDGDNVLLTKEDEMKYKDILTKEVSVVLTKLPIQPCKLPCEEKNNSQDLTLK